MKADELVCRGKRLCLPRWARRTSAPLEHLSGVGGLMSLGLAKEDAVGHARVRSSVPLHASIMRVDLQTSILVSGFIRLRKMVAR